MSEEASAADWEDFWLDDEADVNDWDDPDQEEADQVYQRYRVVIYPKAPAWPRPSHIHLVLARSVEEARGLVEVPENAEIRSVELA